MSNKFSFYVLQIDSSDGKVSRRSKSSSEKKKETTDEDDREDEELDWSHKVSIFYLNFPN